MEVVGSGTYGPRELGHLYMVIAIESEIWVGEEDDEQGVQVPKLTMVGEVQRVSMSIKEEGEGVIWERH